VVFSGTQVWVFNGHGGKKVSVCSFRFDFPMSAEGLIRRVGDAVRSAGGSFAGDAAEGHYTVSTPIGPIAGTYSVSGQTIKIDVTDKPIILSCKLIEKKLNEFIQRARSRYSP
jgi:hypothetical protein